MGLAYEQRILAFYDGGPEIDEAVQAHGEGMKRSILAVGLVKGIPPCFDLAGLVRDCKAMGVPVRLAIFPVGRPYEVRRAC